MMIKDNSKQKVLESKGQQVFLNPDLFKEASSQSSVVRISRSKSEYISYFYLRFCQYKCIKSLDKFMDTYVTHKLIIINKLIIGKKILVGYQS